ncbi:hypothetical protein ACFX2I_038835 [Malus domestica]
MATRLIRRAIASAVASGSTTTASFRYACVRAMASEAQAQQVDLKVPRQNEHQNILNLPVEPGQPEKAGAQGVRDQPQGVRAHSA